MFENLSFTINPGTKVAFVGRSGCGKSTILQLLLKYYEIESGEILVDDYNLNGIDTDYIRSVIGVVQQEPVLFNCSIKDNIAYNLQSATLDAVKKACQMANALRFIEEN